MAGSVVVQAQRGIMLRLHHSASCSHGPVGLSPVLMEQAAYTRVRFARRFPNSIELLHELGIKRTFGPGRSLRDDSTASYRETLPCFARDDTAGAGVGQPEQDVVDGFARSAPNLCDRSGKWDRLETTRSTRHSVGCGCVRRRTAFYHRRKSG